MSMLHGGIHTKIYDEFFGLDGERRSRICEITGSPNAEVAHINASGMGGRASAHVIENLMALHPILHQWTEGRYKEWLTENHAIFMETQRPLTDRKLTDSILGDFLWECADLLPKRWKS